VRTLNLGWGTSNEAEYQTLIAGLRDVLEQLEQAEADPGEAWLEVRGDSQLVLSQIGGSWKAKDARMRRLRDEARSLLGRFGKTKLTRQPREQTVATLGH
jgi:probable phosphoglycerate mutase